MPTRRAEHKEDNKVLESTLTSTMPTRKRKSAKNGEHVDADEKVKRSNVEGVEGEREGVPTLEKVKRKKNGEYVDAHDKVKRSNGGAR